MKVPQLILTSLASRIWKVWEVLLKINVEEITFFLPLAKWWNKKLSKAKISIKSGFKSIWFDDMLGCGFFAGIIPLYRLCNSNLTVFWTSRFLPNFCNKEKCAMEDCALMQMALFVSFWNNSFRNGFPGFMKGPPEGLHITNSPVAVIFVFFQECMKSESVKPKSLDNKCESTQFNAIQLSIINSSCGHKTIKVWFYGILFRYKTAWNMEDITTTTGLLFPLHAQFSYCK